MPSNGVYENLITQALLKELELLDRESLSIQKGKLNHTEVADRLSLHIGRVLRSALANIGDRDRVEAGVELVRRLIDEIDTSVVRAEVAQDQIVESNQILTAILRRNPDGSSPNLPATLTPLLDTTLLTNARGEPRLGAQISSEIESADRIDIVMAFVRLSGIRPFLKAFRRHCERTDDHPGIRLLTTTYTGSTELRALKTLEDLGAEVKVSYDTSSARLHAKSWYFHRKTGFSTAYIGSSNLTHSAQETGIEWNVRVSGIRNPDVLRKMSSVFESYWSGGDFVPFDEAEFERETESNSSPQAHVLLSPIEIRLEPFQDRLLEQIVVSRRQGYHRNLLVAATGTGKTVMAAVDYAKLRQELKRSRLLFVAHREEILEQSMLTFRHALRDASFGEKWVGKSKPKNFEFVFASIQSINAAGLSNLETDHFDVVIVDEFHHSAAPSYRKLLEHLAPQELLGLTATPERTDGLDVLELFDGRIAAELRLWEAIDQNRLAPFVYYGIHDGLDLTEVPWRKGRGYDINELSNLYTGDDIWVRRAIAQLNEKTDELHSMKALGFCVSVQHARFMAHHFAKAGIASAAVWGDTPELERKSALRQLADGKIQILFSVDLFNEGVDVPSVNTLLFFRPTESATLFLQQLGRGLRRSNGKSHCTVFDFVGTHRKEFRFDRRLSGLLGGSRRKLIEQVENAFPYLPAGCHMELDPVAQDIILKSLKSSLPNRWNEKLAELKALIASGMEPSIGNFLQESGLDLEDIYQNDRCWTDYLDAAQSANLKRGPAEDALRRAIGRMLHINDELRLDFYVNLLEKHQPNLEEFSLLERRMVRMLIAGVCDQVLDKTDTLEDAVALLWKHPQVVSELHQLFVLKRQQIDHVHLGLSSREETPLQIHGRYTRIEMLAAFGVGESTAKTRPWREGALWVEEEGVDVLAFTLDKSNGNFSPTTMYRDYAISRDLIHWESQSTTKTTSPTGQRYAKHAEMGTEIMLFAREHANDRAFWFLGPASYVSHESERPMEITWKLQKPLPGDLFSLFAAAVA